MHREDAVDGESPRVSTALISGDAVPDPSPTEADIRGVRHVAALADARLDRLFHSALLSLLGKPTAAPSLPAALDLQQNRSEIAAMADQLKWEVEAKRLIADRTAEFEQLTDDMRNEIFDRMHLIEAMRDGEDHLRLALAATGIGVWRGDLATHQVTIDSNLSRLAGLSPRSRRWPATNCSNSFIPMIARTC